MSRYSFIASEQDLARVLERATPLELSGLVKILRTKTSCTLAEDCRDWREIGRELLLMGGNTLMNFVRWHGVTYRKFIRLAADAVGLPESDTDDPVELEWRLLRHLLASAEARMTEVQRQEYHEKLLKQYRVEVGEHVTEAMERFDGKGLLAATTLAMEVYTPGGGSLVGNLGRFILGVSTSGLSKIMSPAYSIMPAAVIQVATLRLDQRADDAAKEIGGVS